MATSKVPLIVLLTNLLIPLPFRIPPQSRHGLAENGLSYKQMVTTNKQLSDLLKENTALKRQLGERSEVHTQYERRLAMMQESINDLEGRLVSCGVRPPARIYRFVCKGAQRCQPKCNNNFQSTSCCMRLVLLSRLIQQCL